MDRDGGPVLVGFDDSGPARRALDRGAEEARARGVRLLVLVVARRTGDDQVRGVAPPADLGPVIAAAQHRLAACGADGEVRWGLGEPGAEIADVARAAGAQLVVVGHHHHGLLDKLAGHDVGGEVKALAGCEVVRVDPQ